MLTMNWTKNRTPHNANVRTTIAFCAFLCLATYALTAPENIEEYLQNIDEDTFLIIEEGNILIGDPDGLLSTYNEYNLVGIIIEKDAALTLYPLTMLHVSSGQVIVKGTLFVPSTIGTGIYNSTNQWDEVSELQPDKTTEFLIDGGIIKITAGSSPKLIADTVDVTLYKGGGTVDVAEGFVFQSGEVIEAQGNQAGGNIKKTGEGTWEVNGIDMSGIFHVTEGNVTLLDNVTVGTLNSNVVGTLRSNLDTIISGKQDDEGNKSSLTILEGG